MEIPRQDQEDNAMPKSDLKKTKSRRASDKQDLSRQKEMDHLAEELVEVAEEMERVSRET